MGLNLVRGMAACCVAGMMAACSPEEPAGEPAADGASLAGEPILGAENSPVPAPDEPAYTAPEARAPDPEITLTLGGDGDQFAVAYACEGSSEPLAVTYINAGPNELALVPVDGAMLVFVRVISASGARYASGGHEWWIKGQSGELRNLRTDPGTPPMLRCTDITAGGESSDVPAP